MNTNVEVTKFDFSINDILNEIVKLSKEEQDVLLGSCKITDIQYVMNNPEALKEWCCDTEKQIENIAILAESLKKMIVSLGEKEVSQRMSKAEEMLKDWLEKLKKVMK